MHRFHTSLAALVITLSLTLVGCPSSTTAPSTVPIEDLGGRYATTFCGLLTDCYGEVVRDALLGISSEADCIALFERQYMEQALPRYQQAIAEGTMSYDGTQAQACLDATTAQGCAAINSRGTSACDGLLIGEVAPGGVCSINEQCAGDAYCMNTTVCPGTCQPRGSVGATCTSDDACQGGMKCTGGSCTVPAAEGAPCGGATNIECGGGLICAGASATAAGNCRTPETVQNGALHGACNVQMTQLCEPGLSCVVAGLTSMSCETGGLALDAACHVAVPDACASGTFCSGTDVTMGDLDGTCAPLPSAGMNCATVLFGPRCGSGLRCDTGTCRGTSTTGGACATSADCYSGTCTGGACAAAMLCE